MKTTRPTRVLFPRFTAAIPLCVVVACSIAPGLAEGEADGSQQPPELSSDLADLSIEDLMNIEVTSASKKAEKLSEAVAAIFVITQEDIRRSGVTSIPEALRMVPGVQVARLNASTWAISARGFNDQFAQKLLVLIDGRSVYTPLFSGVYWDMQDTMLEDIDRIEVIRGPGGALWGADAAREVARRLETMGRSDDLTEADEACTALERHAEGRVPKVIAFAGEEVQ